MPGLSRPHSVLRVHPCCGRCRCPSFYGCTCSTVCVLSSVDGHWVALTVGCCGRCWGTDPCLAGAAPRGRPADSPAPAPTEPRARPLSGRLCTFPRSSRRDVGSQAQSPPNHPAPAGPSRLVETGSLGPEAWAPRPGPTPGRGRKAGCPRPRGVYLTSKLESVPHPPSCLPSAGERESEGGIVVRSPPPLCLVTQGFHGRGTPDPHSWPWVAGAGGCRRAKPLHAQLSGPLPALLWSFAA